MSSNAENQPKTDSNPKNEANELSQPKTDQDAPAEDQPKNEEKEPSQDSAAEKPQHCFLIQWLINTKVNSGKQNWLVLYTALFEITFLITAYYTYYHQRSFRNHYPKLLAWPLIDCLFNIFVIFFTICLELDNYRVSFLMVLAEGFKFVTICFSFRIVSGESLRHFETWWVIVFFSIWLLLEWATTKVYEKWPYRYYSGFRS